MGTQTVESWFKTILWAKLTTTADSMTVAAIPTVTAGRLYLNNWAQEEWISFTGRSGSVITWLTRWLSKTAIPATAGTWLSWIAGTPVVLVEMHDQMMVADADNVITWDNTFSGNNTFSDIQTWAWVEAALILTDAKKWFGFPDLTTVEREALTAVNGYVCYDSDLGTHMQYIGWAWTNFATWAVVNASDSVAGKVQLNKAATGGDVWSTWAALVPLLSDIGIISPLAWENISAGEVVALNMSDATETQVYTAWGNDASFWTTSWYNFAMRFTCTSTWDVQRLDSMTIPLKKVWSPTDNVLFKIYQDDLISPIEDSVVVAWWDVTTSYVETAFTFSTNNLIPWKSYWLVACRSWTEDDSNFYRWEYDNDWSWATTFYKFNTTNWAPTWSTWYHPNFATSVTAKTYDPTTVVLADANDSHLCNAIGIATETITSGNAIKIQTSGSVTTTWLTTWAKYYLSDTAGWLSTTQSTTYRRQIGEALSTTQLKLDFIQQMNYSRNFTLNDTKYNWSSVNFNWAWTNKYIRVYTWFRPRKFNIIWWLTNGTTTGGTSIWQSDWVTNTCIRIVNSSSSFSINTLIATYSFQFSYMAWNSESFFGTVSVLDKWFEIYYSKADTTALNNSTLNILAE